MVKISAVPSHFFTSFLLCLIYFQFVLLLQPFFVSHSPSVLANAFYLPGIAPVDYEEGATLQVFANKLTSPINKLPYDYFSLPLCKIVGKETKKKLNLGQILIGERATLTNYDIKMLIPASCLKLCEVPIDENLEKRLKKLIRDDYRVRLNMDNMPLVVRGTLSSGESAFQFGYPLGTPLADQSSDTKGKKKHQKLALFNHLKFTVLYHKPEFSLTEKYFEAGNKPVFRVVGFEVEIASIQHSLSNKGEGEISSCADIKYPFAQNPALVEKGRTVIFSYDVAFVESPIRWATRWDPLLKASTQSKQIQWFSISNSFMIVLFLAGIVAIILLRTLHQDFIRYNRLEDEDEVLDESGWKLVHGDVFRTPSYAPILCILYGSGAHVTWIFATTICFAAFGFLSPANRGGLLTALLTIWIFTSSISGYASSRLNNAFGGTNRTFVTVGSAFGFSGLVFTIFFTLNIVVWANGSSGAVPFLTLLLIIFLWFGMSIPLTILGSYIAYKQKTIIFPTRTNHIPREIPEPPYGISPNFYPLITGAVPFAVIFMELVFIMSSLWQNRVYYMFGFLFLVYVLLCITCAEISIVFTYMRLSGEDYRWWWGAFNYSASMGIYVFLYSFIYYETQTELEFSSHLVSTFLYFGYMFVISVAISIMAGFVGFFSTLLFVLRIYSSIRVD